MAKKKRKEREKRGRCLDGDGVGVGVRVLDVAQNVIIEHRIVLLDENARGRALGGVLGDNAVRPDREEEARGLHEARHEAREETGGHKVEANDAN